MGETVCGGGVCVTIPGFPSGMPPNPNHIPICQSIYPGMTGACGGGGGGFPCCAPCGGCPGGSGAMYLASSSNIGIKPLCYVT